MDNIKYMVSVVMLTYNQEKYVEESIRGVMHQNTNFEVELVIFDDASTDSTVEICRKWQKLYPNNIHITVNETNIGISRNYVNALKAANGKYIAMCDSDDYWIDPNKLQIQVDFLESHPDFAITFHRVINYYQQDGSKSLSNGGQKQISDITDLSKGNFITNLSSVSRNNLFEKGDYLTGFTLLDYALHMLNAKHGKIYYFNRVMGVYRKNESGLWTGAGAKRYLEAMTVREFLMDKFRENAEVYNNLLTAYNANAFAALRQLKGTKDEETTNFILNKLHTLNPNMTIDNIWGVVNKPLPKPTAKQDIMFAIKRVRAFVTKFLPLPHSK